MWWSVIGQIDDVLWSYIGFPAILFIGLYFSYTSKCIQIRAFPSVCRLFKDFLFNNQKNTQAHSQKGIHPIAAFFAGLGGCVGIGNVVAITSAIQIGGPGAIIWIWLAALIGSTIKYAEVYLGMQYRKEENGSYSGGPTYYLPKAIAPWAGILFCIFMSIYGIEIYQFSVVVESISSCFMINKWYVVLALLFLVLFAEHGGIKRIGAISSAIIPLFILIYLSMGMYVVVSNLNAIPLVFKEILCSAFSGHAPVGGFVGSTLILTISQGIRRGCYSSDIGVGYASIIHSTSRVKEPAKQASLVIFEVFLDTFIICSMSIFLVLLTGTWKQSISEMLLVQVALSAYFPYMEYFMPAFFALLGYSTIISFYFAGMKTAVYLSPKWGRYIYNIYASIAFIFFSFMSMTNALIVMSIVQVILLALNLTGIFRLRNKIEFNCI